MLFRSPGELSPQHRILGRHADRAGVQVALAHHDAALDDERRRREAELVGAEHRADHDVSPGLHLAIHLHGDPTAQAVEDQRLVGLREAELPGCSGVLDRRPRRSAGAHRSVAIKQAIMNNALLSGVGNIYASEALFYAGIHPQRQAKSLTKQEWNKLTKTIKQVIEEGIEAGGTTFDGKYVDADGLAGGYQEKLMVYGRDGEACQNCGATIEKIKLGGRGTFFCPQCQI